MRSTELWETRPATPEDVLALLREDLRHGGVPGMGADSEPPLTFDTPIATWEDADDFDGFLGGWKTTAATLSIRLGVSVPLQDWKPVLTPRRQRTLGGLCAFLAPHLRVPVVAPFRVAGLPCATAGAFLALRTALLRAGLPVAGARPSAPLPVHSWEQLTAFTRAVTRLAPGVLPVPRVRAATAVRRGGLAFLAGLVLIVPAGLLRIDALGWLGALLCLGGIAGVLLTSKAPPKSVHFEGLSTLGDVARAMAAPRGVESPPC